MIRDAIKAVCPKCGRSVGVFIPRRDDVTPSLFRHFIPGRARFCAGSLMTVDPKTRQPVK